MEVKRPYLMMNIHLHVVCELIAPPTIGPSSSANELTMDSCETYAEKRAGSTTSVMIT